MNTANLSLVTSVSSDGNSANLHSNAPADQSETSLQKDTQNAPGAQSKSIHDRIQSVVEDINQKLQHENRQVVFDYDAKVNRIWLNVVDKSTGKVIEEMPPKVIRQIVDSLGPVKGLVIDTHS